MTEADSSHTPLGALQNKVSRTNPRNHGPAGKLEPTFITNFAKMTAPTGKQLVKLHRKKGEDGNVCIRAISGQTRETPSTRHPLVFLEERRKAWSSLVQPRGWFFPRWRKALALTWFQDGMFIKLGDRGQASSFPKAMPGNWSDSPDWVNFRLSAPAPCGSALVSAGCRGAPASLEPAETTA